MPGAAVAPKFRLTVQKRSVEVDEVSVSVEARAGRRRVKPEILHTTAGDIERARYSEGVSVHLAQWDREHSGVSLGIYSTHRDDNGDEYQGAFEEFVTPEQLDQIIELLIATRDKAREVGILTPRELPKAKSA